MIEQFYTVFFQFVYGHQPCCLYLGDEYWIEDFALLRKKVLYR